jgi:hypothetical protein
MQLRLQPYCAVLVQNPAISLRVVSAFDSRQTASAWLDMSLLQIPQPVFGVGTLDMLPTAPLLLADGTAVGDVTC